jgi:hypothetical protein
VKPGAMTLGAVIVLSACASDSETAGTTPRATAASTTAASTTVATATVATTTTTNATIGSLGGESVLALRMCVNALVDDPSAPGANFVEKVQKLSVGYPMVEPLAAAQALCNDASATLEAEAGEAGSPSANVLADTEEINTALDLAVHQIRTDGFYFGGSLPAQFIPDGATALRQSIEHFYSRVSVVLG